METIDMSVIEQPPILSRRARTKRGFKRFMLAILALLIIGIGWAGWHLYSDASKLTGNKNPISLLSSLWPQPLDTTDGRTNILLTGYSVDDPGHQGAKLTDSIMVLSIDQQTHKATVISIPRDLWVDVPGHGYEKINAAYEQGGISLLEQVVENDLGININYYALIDYTAFRDAVNAVGGVTVTINSPDPRGVYDSNTGIKLPNGTVKLDGDQALALARSRGDGRVTYGFPLGDFNRIQYQQQILLALKTKATSTGTVLNPLKTIKLIDSIGNNVQTDMGTGQLETLYSASKKISNSNIQTVTLNKINGQTLLRSYTAYDGESAFIPVEGLNDYGDIQSAVQQLLQ